MKIEVIGVEVGVLLSPDDKEFEFYSFNNKDLPYGFYDESQWCEEKRDFEKVKDVVRKYVEQGVDETYGIISVQYPVDYDPYDEDFEGLDEVLSSYELDYEFYKDANAVLYSVCKKDGELIEGFLEAELEKISCDKEADFNVSQSFEDVLDDAYSRLDKVNKGVPCEDKLTFEQEIAAEETNLAGVEDDLVL